MPEDLRQIAATPAENVEIAGVRITLQLLLNQKRQTLHAPPHIGVARRDPDPTPRRNRDQERSAFKVAEINADGAQRRSERAPPFSSTENGGPTELAGGMAPTKRRRLNNNRRKAGCARIRLLPRLTPPFVDEARANILAPRHLRDNGPGRLYPLKSAPLLGAPTPPSLAPVINVICPCCAASLAHKANLAAQHHTPIVACHVDEDVSQQQARGLNFPSATGTLNVVIEL